MLRVLVSSVFLAAAPPAMGAPPFDIDAYTSVPIYPNSPRLSFIERSGNPNDEPAWGYFDKLRPRLNSSTPNGVCHGGDSSSGSTGIYASAVVDAVTASASNKELFQKLSNNSPAENQKLRSLEQEVDTDMLTAVVDKDFWEAFGRARRIVDLVNISAVLAKQFCVHKYHSFPKPKASGDKNYWGFYWYGKQDNCLKRTKPGQETLGVGATCTQFPEDPPQTDHKSKTPYQWYTENVIPVLGKLRETFIIDGKVDTGALDRLTDDRSLLLDHLDAATLEKRFLFKWQQDPIDTRQASYTTIATQQVAETIPESVRSNVEHANNEVKTHLSAKLGFNLQHRSDDVSWLKNDEGKNYFNSRMELAGSKTGRMDVWSAEAVKDIVHEFFGKDAVATLFIGKDSKILLDIFVAAADHYTPAPGTDGPPPSGDHPQPSGPGEDGPPGSPHHPPRTGPSKKGWRFKTDILIILISVVALLVLLGIGVMVWWKCKGQSTERGASNHYRSTSVEEEDSDTSLSSDRG